MKIRDFKIVRKSVTIGVAVFFILCGMFYVSKHYFFDEQKAINEIVDSMVLTEVDETAQGATNTSKENIDESKAVYNVGRKDIPPIIKSLEAAVDADFASGVYNLYNCKGSRNLNGGLIIKLGEQCENRKLSGILDKKGYSCDILTKYEENENSSYDYEDLNIKKYIGEDFGFEFFTKEDEQFIQDLMVSPFEKRVEGNNVTYYTFHLTDIPLYHTMENRIKVPVCYSEKSCENFIEIGIFNGEICSIKQSSIINLEDNTYFGDDKILYGVGTVSVTINDDGITF